MAHADLFQVDDIITINNHPGVPSDMKWRVVEIAAGKGIRIRPAGNNPRDRFNDEAGEFWIAGPTDRPFD